MHLSDGTLRRWVDESFVIDEARSQHLQGCDRCRQRAGEVRATAEWAATLLATAPEATDPAAALARIEARTGSAGAFQPRAGAWLRDPRRGARMSRRLTAGLGAVALAGALMAAGVAQGFITIFQPEQLTPIAVSGADFATLKELASYGDVSGVPTLTLMPATRAEAQQATGVTLASPLRLPSTIPSTPSYDVISGGTVLFTFDQAKAAAAARHHGATLPPMLATIDGSTLRLTLPSVLVESYGIDAGGLLPATGSSAASSGQPAVLIVASRVPTVSSTGATAAEIEDYLLAQPAIPADLAAEIRAMGDPSTTLPVPIPVSVASAQRVSVGGASGLLVGDQSGAGSLVLWEHSGVIYGVLGSLTADQVLAVADQIG